MYHVSRTVTSKGQITLPIALCRKYGIRRGDPLLLDVVNGDLVIQPIRMAAIRFDAAYRRFSIRGTSRDGTRELGVLSNLPPQHVVLLSKDPTAPERARSAPNQWVSLVHPRGASHLPEARREVECHKPANEQARDPL